MSDTNYDDLIVGALIGVGGSVDHWLRVRAKAHPEWLIGAHRTIYEIASRYFGLTGEPIDYERWLDMLNGSDVEPSRRMVLDQEFARLWHLEVPEAHFRYALHAVKEKRRDEHFAAGLIDALRAMTDGTGGVRGYEVARPILTEALAHVDQHFNADSPEGDIRLDSALVMEDYQRRKANEGLTERMVQTGIDDIDATLVGLSPGENCLVAGYSGHGKTTLIQNVAWHAAVKQGKDVVVFTNENAYEAYRARIFNRHAHEIVEGGISMTTIKAGELSEEQEAHWAATCNDFGTNPAYGTLYVVQMPMGGSMDWVLPQLDRFAEQLDPDLLVLDYIGRMGSITRRTSKREEINDNLIAWKNALVGFDGGRGIPGITGYQIKREALLEAQIRGYYDLTCLAETSEAERNADVVLSILRMEDIEREVRLQVIKNRDGAPLEATPFPCDFATTWIGSAGAGGGWI